MMVENRARNQQASADFQRDCIELATLLPHSYEQIHEAALQVAYGSTHPNHLVAGHLLELLKNKWRVEGTPKKFQIQAVIDFPYECSQNCLKRFYALLEKEGAGE